MNFKSNSQKNDFNDKYFVFGMYKPLREQHLTALEINTLV